MPTSMFLFIATGFIFAIQAIPYLGIIFMMFMAPYWSVVTVNLAFASMAQESLSGIWPKFVLVVPILWFGGYGIAAVASHHQAGKFVQAEMDVNAGKHVDFQPARQDLVLRNSVRSVINYSTLLKEFDLPIVYLRNSYERGNNLKCTKRQSVKIQSAPCAKGSGIVGKTKEGCSIITNSVGYRDSSGRLRSIPGKCIAITSGKPKPNRDTVLLSVENKQDIRSFLLAGTVRELLISPKNAKSVTLRIGRVKPLAWFPMPVMGCGLNSGNPSWDCSAGFVRGDAVTIPTFEVLANTLGLQRVTVQERFLSTETNSDSN